MISNDGNYIIYIIMHLYKDNPKNRWAHSGECRQWIPHDVFRLEHENLIYRGIFKPFSANGDCWQKTNIHGSFDKQDALEILYKIAEWNPQNRYRVCKVEISQKITTMAELKITPPSLSG